MIKSTILVILDGWGIGSQDNTNPIYATPTPNLNFIKKNFPGGSLQAAGIAAGLPWEEHGNSQTSHLLIGAGRLIYQNYPRISLAIRDESFFKKPILSQIASHIKQTTGTLQLVGLLTNSNIDASLEHLLAIIKFADMMNLPYRLHLFTDGQNTSPRAAASLISQLPDANKIASLSGRYYALDNDEHWDRTETAYQALIGKAPIAKDINTALSANYKQNLSDTFLHPTIISENLSPLTPGDAIVFFNFGEDNIRQLASAFLDPNFNQFSIASFPNTFFATLVPYANSFTTPSIFPQINIDQPLTKTTAAAGLTTIKIGETLKYSELTYFFNGLDEKPVKNEYRIIFPSLNTTHPDSTPALRAPEITNRGLESLSEHAFNLIILNYANADIIGHTGNFAAAKKSVAVIDNELGKLLKAASTQNNSLLILGSHGNIEKMLNPHTGAALTQNTNNPVPIYLVNNNFRLNKDDFRLAQEESSTIGLLSDIAPTILELLQVSQPAEMTGQSLLRYLL